MIRELAAIGHTVHVVCLDDMSQLPEHAHDGWTISQLLEKPEFNISQPAARTLYGWVPVRWMEYWGIPIWTLPAINKEIAVFQPDALISVGLQVAPLAATVLNVPSLWYTADDWVLHHLTLAGKGPLRSRARSLKKAVLSLCYERSLSPRIGGAIAVSRKDQKALRHAGGFQEVALIPNGVDADFFNPRPEKESDKPSICFWGRMDFAPNVDAATWFCTEVWPLLLKSFPEAVMTVVGTDPTPAVNELGLNRNVRVTGEVDDIRPFAWHSQVVVMPLRTGGGIKNKLLEACAMGKPIVASQTAVAGLDTRNESSGPWIVARSKKDWAESIKLLWTNREIRLRLGRSARDYVVGNHSWRMAANKLVDFIGKLK